MPGEVSSALEGIRASLAAAMPGRVVSRSFRPLSQLSDPELRRGVVAVVCLEEDGYANYRGREAQLGRLKVLLVAHLRVADKAAPVEVEDAEWALAEEVKAWLAGSLPVRECLLQTLRQSGQLEAPYGWVVMELEVMP